MATTKSPRSRRVSTAAVLAPVPQDMAEAAATVAKIGELQRKITRVAADMNDALAATRERYETEAQEMQRRVDSLTEGLQVFANANRRALTQDGKTKTARLPSGEIGWRQRPPSVRITGVDAVLAALREANLDRMIRVKAEVNREAILGDPAAVAEIPGIAIAQGEDFFVMPFETALAGTGGEAA